MIVLDVESYCHNCEAFDPKVTRITFTSYDDMCEHTEETRVSCVDARKCAWLYRCIKKEVEKNG